MQDKDMIMPETEPETDDWYDEDEDVGIPSAWVCDSDSKAEWCISKYREAEKELKNWTTFYADQLEKVRKRCEATMNTMLVYLRGYYKTQEENGHAKLTKTAGKYALPSGTLTMKRGTWEYKRDDDKLVPWLESAGMTDLIKVKQSADWAGLKSQTSTLDDGTVILTETGEVVEGVNAAMKPDSFELK